MSDPERLTETVTATAEMDDAIALVLRKAENIWEVAYEDIAIELELHEETGRLVLSADLGVPPRERRLAVLDALLSYAMLWRETGFVRVAAGGGAGPLALLADISADALRAATLASILANFAQKARVWRDYATAEAEPIATSDIHHLENALRI